MMTMMMMLMMMLLMMIYKYNNKGKTEIRQKVMMRMGGCI